jgi:hypothetical protein
VSKENGFVPLRRGLWEHVKDGRMSHLEALAFVYICSQADTRTGAWNGSAGALAGEMALSVRTARDLLEKLEHGDYIRRFATPGKHVCYPILVHKFPLTQGEHNGEQLDAISSSKIEGCIELRYFSCQHNGEQHGEHSAAQRIQENRDKRSKAAKPPADARYGPFLELAKTSFESKNGHPPTWDCFGKDGAALAAFLRRAPHVTLDVWTAHLNAYLDSTEQFTVKQGGGLSYFVSRFDTFSNGPILAVQGKATNGRLNPNEAVAITMRGAAVNGRRVN